MKIPSPQCIFLLISCFWLIPAVSQAEIIGYDNFDSYPDGSLDGMTGGKFWDWDNRVGSASHTGQTASWREVGTASIAGGKLITQSGGCLRSYNGTSLGAAPSDEANGGINGSASSFHKVIYYRVDITRSIGSTGFAGLSSFEFGAEPLFFGVPFTFGRAPFFGLVDGGNFFSTRVANVDQIYTMVVKIDFEGDELKMWLDPDLTQPEASNVPIFSKAYTNEDLSTAIRLASSSETTWDNLIVTAGSGAWEELGTIDGAPGEPLDSERRVAAGGANDHDPYFQDFGNAITLNNGNIVVSYEARSKTGTTPESPDGDEAGGYLRIYSPDGEPLTAAPIMPYDDINPLGTGYQIKPIVTALSQGGFVATWGSSDGPSDVGFGSFAFGTGDAYFRVFDSQGAPVGGTLRVNTGEPNGVDDNQAPLAVTALPSGGFVILYIDENDNTTLTDPNSDDLFIRQFGATGSAITSSLRLGDTAIHGPLFQTAVNNGPDSRSLIALDDGGYAVAWTSRSSGTGASADGDSWGCFVQTFTFFGTASSAVFTPYSDLNPTGTGAQQDPILTPLSGRFAVTWNSVGAAGDEGTGFNSTSGGDAYVGIFSNDGTRIGSSAKVNDQTNISQERPVAIRSLTGGNIVVVWADDEDSTGTPAGDNKDDYFVRVYNASGVPLGASTRLGDSVVHESLFQDFGNIEPLADGGFVTCWRTRDDGATNSDGDGYGAFFQVFNADGSARTTFLTPYADINPAGTGDQGSPVVSALSDGSFAVAWQSEDGSGDVLEDVYTRVFTSQGIPASSSIKAYTAQPAGVDDDQFPEALAPTDMGYALITRDDNNDVAASNGDDFFIRFFRDATVRPAASRVVTVTTLDDDGVGSLRAAIAEAGPGATTIQFDPSLSGMRIVLTGSKISMFDENTLAIDATTLPRGITLDGGGNSGIFDIGSGTAASIHGLTLTGGNAFLGAAILNAHGRLTVSASTFYGNTATSGGGAIFSDTDLSGFSKTSLIRCTFTENSADFGGGAIHNDDGLTALMFCTIAGNTSIPDSGGGISSFGDTITTTTLLGTIVRDNTGGDLENKGAATEVQSFVSEGSNIVGTGDGVAAFTQTGDQTGEPFPVGLAPLGDYGGSVPVMHLLATSPAINAASTAVSDGDQRGVTVDSTPDIGAVEVGPVSLVTTAADGTDPGTLRTILASPLPHGAVVRFDPTVFPATIMLTGAIEFVSTAGVIVDASDYFGTVTLDGQGLNQHFSVGNDRFALHSLTLQNGISSLNGGSIFCISSNLTIANCSLLDNQGTFGGAIAAFDSDLTIDHTTFSGNTATNDGGAIGIDQGSVRLTHITAIRNSTSGEGGGIYLINGELDLRNSIVAENSAGFAADFRSITSNVNVRGKNLFSSLAGSDLVANANVLVSPEIRLSERVDLGSVGPFFLPLPGSPAIDQLDDIPLNSSDQTNAVSPFNGMTDIGAIEYQGANDLQYIWLTDQDGDGSTYGVEFALGTNPFVSDPENLQNPQFSVNAQGQPVYRFGYDYAAIGTANYIVERSFSLELGSWEEVYVSADPDNGETTDFDVSIDAATAVTITDTSSPLPEKVFFRFLTVGP
ncbi:MAG: choice-of-anchor Q domain-containing protein [Luteolibacter sp.]